MISDTFRFQNIDREGTMFYFSIVIIIASQVVYQIAQKSVPHTVHPVISTMISYCVAMALCVAVYIVAPAKENLWEHVKAANWATYLVGLAIVGIELGFLLAYRSGWNVSVGAVTANVILSVVLIPIGMWLFKEEVSWVNVAGIVLCIVGLVLATKK